MNHHLKYVLLFFIAMLCCNTFSAQAKKPKDINYIKTLIEQNHILKAETELTTQINDFKNQKNYDTLVHYIYDLGSVSILKNEPIDKAIQLSKDISKATKNKLLLSQLNLEVAKLYFEQNKTSKAYLENLLLEVNEALLIIEGRKSVISSLKSVNTLLEYNNDVFDFAKKLNMKLYELTKNPKYLNELIKLNESAFYNRIRTRLNINNGIYFADVPKKIIDKENSIRSQLNIKVEGEDNPEAAIESNKEWPQFLKTIKKEYPKYYKMRYGSIGESLDYLKDKVAPNVTVLRYFFIDDHLYVFIIRQDSLKLFKLDYESVKNHIQELKKNQYQLPKTNDLLFELYQALWQPFVKEITTKNIVIIPDGNLYNLSFEILTPTKIKSFKDLGKKSLLAKYNITYNYSLYLLEQNKNTTKYKNNFVAFAPEFNDKMKESYKLAITDSIHLDKTYLELQQQPLNVGLAKISARLFDGDYFLNENATEKTFKKNANEHKIIHIGTHAESNNISPELSRLIFAKNISDPSEDGSLYAFEIYNTNLNSNIAILTACETEKPSYQAGEGMIALAHAFNYAGSESILTSLWKADEPSTNQIIEHFYRYISDGRPKDEALRLAKLTYIKNTKGKSLSPQFWAGLVLMGDTNPLTISNPTPFWQGLVILVSLILIASLILKLKKN
ncbi:CHAT domain-containing protein [Mariniflexile fucanivorans]|uniref:CHAT domain-containing protein n=1 Tax=Mariniflexile fucanivorans TaxID=264023 RepID=A0A4R1RF23_9FLAO|nr:CHAT domain-containing protein [Mariniflexile fucanivorans]TCL64535.1 CHAT domain-containing protein [Mariniflexile fucanivorans]